MGTVLILLAAAASYATAAQAEVRVSYAATDHPTVPTYINGQGPYALVFATGAEGTALYSAFARQLELEPLKGRSEVLQGQARAFESSTCRCLRPSAWRIGQP